MAKRPAHIEDDDHLDSVEMTPLMQQMADDEEARQKAVAEAADDDDDDDDDDFSDIDDDIEEEDADDDEEEDDDDEEEEESLTAVPRVPRKGDDKPKSKAQKRIQELASKRRDAEKLAFDAEMEVIAERKKSEALAARIEALENGTSTPTAKAKKPDPADFDYGEVDTKFIDATVEYRLAIERDKFQSEQSSRSAEERQTERAKHYKDRLAKVQTEGTKKYGKKYDSVVNTTNFPGDVARDLLDSDFGVDISYYLAKNIGKLRELTLMEAPQRAKMMGRLEERFSARSSAGKKTTKAPETPGRKAKASQKADPRYGPDDQDEFDRAFFGN